MIELVFIFVFFLCVFVGLMLARSDLANPLAFVPLVFGFHFCVPVVVFWLDKFSFESNALILVLGVFLCHMAGIGCSLLGARKTRASAKTSVGPKQDFWLPRKFAILLIASICALIVVFVSIEYSRYGFRLFSSVEEIQTASTAYRGMFYMGEYEDDYVTRATPVLILFVVFLSAVHFVRMLGRPKHLSDAMAITTPIVLVFLHSLAFSARMLLAMALMMWISAFLVLGLYFSRKLSFSLKKVLLGTTGIVGSFFLLTLPLSVRAGYFVMAEKGGQTLRDFFGYFAGYVLWYDACFTFGHCERQTFFFADTSTNLLTALADMVYLVGVPSTLLLSFATGILCGYAFVKVKFSQSLLFAMILIAAYTYLLFYNTRILFEYQSFAAALCMYYGTEKFFEIWKRGRRTHLQGTSRSALGYGRLG